MNEKIVIIQGYSLAIIAFIVGLALMGNTTLTTSISPRLLSIPNYVAFLCIIATLVRSPKFFRPSGYLVFIVLFYWILKSIYVYNGYSPTFGFLELLILLTICCVYEGSLFLAFKVYRVALVVMTAIGVIAYISFLFSIPIPYTIDPYYANDGLTGYYYINYQWAYIFVDDTGARLCGMFNEPGLFGTILALLLIADKFNLKKPGNVIMLIGGFFSYSLAFFVLLFLFFITKVIQNPKFVKYIILIALIGVLVLPALIQQNEMAASLVERMTIDSGGLAGDNRTGEHFDKLYRRMFDSGNFLFGYGNGFNITHNVGGLSYKKYIIQYGIVGMIIIWGGLFVFSFKKCKKNRDCLIFLICFFVSIYQRPNIIAINYFLILFGGIAYLKQLSVSDGMSCKENKNKNLIKQLINIFAK